MTESIVRWMSALAILLFSVSLIAMTAEVEPLSVTWDHAYPITWDLFQGSPPADAVQRTEAAAIHMTIRWHASYSVSSANGTAWTGQVASITVTNTMEPSRSWVVPGKTFANVLSHEQMHFDLNEVYRRKLECLLLATGTCDSTTQQGAIDLLNATLHQTANIVLQQVSDMQALYDIQTSHGNDRAEQARWETLISNWLIAPTMAP